MRLCISSWSIGKSPFFPEDHCLSRLDQASITYYMTSIQTYEYISGLQTLLPD